MAHRKNQQIMRLIPEGSTPIPFVDWLMDHGYEQDPDYPAMMAPDGHVYVVTRVKQEYEAHTGCPDCGTYDCTIQAYKVLVREAQPLKNDTPVTYIVRVPVFTCDNPECARKTFTQKYTVVKDYARRTSDAECLIVTVGLFVSSLTAQLMLRALGVDISDSTIRRIIDDIPIPDDPDIEWIGIDEVALLRGRVYFTIIYNGETHAPIALMLGKDGVELEKWLRAHPHIKVVDRDRDSVFAQTIDAVLPDCIQVADRFHVYKNITDHITEEIRKHLPTMLYWSEEDGLLAKKPKGDSIIMRDVTHEEGYLNLAEYDDAPPLDGNGQVLEFVHEDPNSTENRKKRQKAEEEYEETTALRETYALERSGEHFHDAQLRQALRDELHLSYTELKEKLAMSDEQVEDLLHVIPNPPPSFASMEYKMLRDGVDPAYIFNYVLERGYIGNLEDLRKSIQNISLYNGFGKLRASAICTFRGLPKGVHAIHPREIGEYMAAKGETRAAMATTPVAAAYEAITKQYPIVSALNDIYEDFDAMFNQVDPEHPEMTPNPDVLDAFCDKYAQSPLKGFVERLRSDNGPVKNAITRSENSGFVEGGNCRLQLTKRMMFGRAGAPHLLTMLYGQHCLRHGTVELKELRSGTLPSRARIL